MIKNNYWSKHDFEVNKHLWIKKGIKKAESIRKDNLVDLSMTLKGFNIPFWLQGRTLLGAFSYGRLLDDHDDDLGVDYKYKCTIEGEFSDALRGLGFKKIRENSSMISYIRNDRYIDICLFKSKNRKYGYSGKWFPRRFFKHLDWIQFLGLKMPVPNNTKILLDIMYRNHFFLLLNKMSYLVTSPSKYLSLFRKIINILLNNVPHTVRRLTAWLFIPFGIRYRNFSIDEFNELMFEGEDSFNWRWRKPHLDIITNNKKSIRIKEILDYINSIGGLDILILKVHETDTSSVFYTPHNFDPMFWQSGNNYFIYNMKYQFRKGVVQYSDANQYIRSGKKPKLYTSKYYQSLDLMSDSDIIKFMRKYPIEISNGAVTGGKHRVSAMIGRMLSNKNYIPMWSIIRKYEDD